MFIRIIEHYFNFFLVIFIDNTATSVRFFHNTTLAFGPPYPRVFSEILTFDILLTGPLEWRCHAHLTLHNLVIRNDLFDLRNDLHRNYSNWPTLAEGDLRTFDIRYFGN